MTPAPVTCSKCGSSLDVRSVQGLCAACLLESSLGPEEAPSSAEPGIDTAWLNVHGIAPPPAEIDAARQFGDYELMGEVGRGGMGVIFKARHVRLNRVVALKMVLAGPIASPDFVQRFQIEARAAAGLDHPHIVPIYEVGELQGQQYYTMRLVDGPNLAQHLKRSVTPEPRRAAEWMAVVARAVHYAHQRGVLHRDLKPANILLDADGQPHVSDFGLAKLLEEGDGLTLTQAALGTPNYMAPEQAAGKAGDLTTAADTYSLGAILFEMLTGQKLFASATPLATINRARDQEPPRPSAILRSTPRDLDTICLKCLEKEPHRRYATAEALADDLERWLAGEPIHARRVGRIERLGLWCRRKPAMAGLAGASLLALLIASGIASWRVAVARHQKELEQYSANISLADAYIRDGGIDRALELLLECPPKLRHWEWGRLLYMCHQEVASIPAHTNRPQYLMQSLIRGLAANRDGTRLVTHGTDGQLKLWDPWRPDPLLVRGDATNTVVAWEFNPEGSQLAVGMRDGTLLLFDTGAGRPVWSVRTTNSAQGQTSTRGQPPQPKRIIGVAYDPREDMPIYDPASAEPETVLALGYAPDGRRIAAATANGVITSRDAETGRELIAWRHSLTNLEALWFTPDGTLLVAKDRLAIEQFESGTGRLLATHRWDPNEHAALFVDASGRNGATLDHARRVQLWRDGEKTHALGRMTGHAEVYRRVWFNPTGRWLCIAGEAGHARLHDVATGRLLFSAPYNVFGAAFSPDGDRLVTFGPERLIRLWDVTLQQELRVLRGHLSVPDQATFSTDGNFIATASRDGMVKLWTGTAGRERIQFGGLLDTVAYSPDGRQWATAPPFEGAYVHDSDSGKTTAVFPYHRIQGIGITFSSDGMFLLTGGTDKAAHIWDLREHRLAGMLRGHNRWVESVACSADGRWFATGDAGGRVRIWDAVTRQQRWNFEAQPRDVWSVQFNPASRKLVTAGSGQPRVWDVETGRLLLTLDDEGGGTWWATFSPDGHRLIAACLDHQIRFWDANSGRVLERHTSRSQGAGLWGHSPDGRRLVVSVSDLASMGMASASLELWDIEHGRRLLDLQGHTDAVPGCTFSPDGRRILSSSMDKTVRQWETFPWREAEFAAFPGKTLPERIRGYAGLYWKERVAAERPMIQGTNAVPFSTETSGAPPEWETAAWPVRAVGTSSNLVNLDGHYTSSLDCIFFPTLQEFELDDDLSQLPAGEHIFGGVPFDVRGVVVLQCGVQGKFYSPPWLRHPVRVDGIRIGAWARRIHVLHAAVGEAAVSTVIGSYVLHYTDGTDKELEIVYGRDLRDWWHGGRGDPAAEVTAAQVAWTGSNPVVKRFDASLRLFLRTYDNPRPDAEIVSVDFVSKLTPAAPFLVAMTVEP